MIRKKLLPPSALADAQARVTVLEQELQRAERAIQRSKKATGLRESSRERQALSAKLCAQEDDFRAQNQALLTELSNVSVDR